MAIKTPVTRGGGMLKNLVQIPSQDPVSLQAPKDQQARTDWMMRWGPNMVRPYAPGIEPLDSFTLANSSTQSKPHIPSVFGVGSPMRTPAPMTGAGPSPMLGAGGNYSGVLGGSNSLFGKTATGGPDAMFGQGAGIDAATNSIRQDLDGFRAADLQRRDNARSGMNAFEAQQAERNRAGMLDASRSTYYNQLPGSGIGPQNIPPHLQRANQALDGVMPERVPPEMQGFVASQQRFQNTPTPMVNSQEGILPGNPWYDNQPRQRAPANEYGLSRMPKNPIATPEAAASGKDGPLASYGRSTLKRIGGKNVLVGNYKNELNSKAPGEATQGDVRRAIREGQERYMARDPDTGEYLNPDYAALMKYKGKINNAKREKDALLRQGALNRKLTQMGSPGLGAYESSGVKKPGSSGYSLNAQDRTKFGDPARSKEISDANGFLPTDKTYKVIGSINDRWDNIPEDDEHGRNLFVQGVIAHTESPSFKAETPETQQKIYDWLKSQGAKVPNKDKKKQIEGGPQGTWSEFFRLDRKPKGSSPESGFYGLPDPGYVSP